MEDDKKTHYEVLGVPPSASFSEIKGAFLSIAKKLHPDKRSGDFFADEKFREVTEAYRVLSDSGLRYVYDMELGIQPEADVIPVSARIEEPTVTGNAAVDYVEALAGGITFPVLTEVEESVFEFEGMDDPLVRKAYSAGLYSFDKLSGLSSRRYYECGMKALRGKKYEAAVFFLSEAVRMNPANLQYRFALGAGFAGSGSRESAASEYREVIRLGDLKGYSCVPVREALIGLCLEAEDYGGVKEQAREIMRRRLKSITAENALKIARERGRSSGGGGDEKAG